MIRENDPNFQTDVHIAITSYLDRLISEKIVPDSEHRRSIKQKILLDIPVMYRAYFDDPESFPDKGFRFKNGRLEAVEEIGFSFDLSSVFHFLWIYFRYIFGILYFSFLSIINGEKKSSSFNVFFSADLNLGAGKASIVRETLENFSESNILDSDMLIIEGVSKDNFTDPHIVISSNPIKDLFVRAPLTWVDLIKLSLFSLSNSWVFLRLVLKHPVHLLMAREFGLLSGIELLNQKRLLKNFYITNSRYNNQEFWLNQLDDRHYKSHIFWYSTNSVGFEFKNAKAHVPYPPHLVLKVDNSWCWNEDFNKGLKSQTQIKNFYLSRPFIWGAPKKQKNSTLDIVIFDVQTVPRKWIVDNLSKGFYHYYSTETLKQFLFDVIDVVNELKIDSKIYIKPKRSVASFHCQEYVKVVKDYIESGALQLIPAETELTEVLEKSHLSIVIPFSSPASIGRYFGFNTVYYDPKSILVSSDTSVPLIQGRNELKKKLLEYFSSRKN